MKNSLVSGSLAMIQPAWHHVSDSNDHRAGELHQASLMSALMAGIYEGGATCGEVRKYGDFGLGTFNGLDGEVVGFDGTFYQLRSYGSGRPVTADQKTTFAVVTFFQPEKERENQSGGGITSPRSRQSLVPHPARPFRGVTNHKARARISQAKAACGRGLIRNVVL